MRAYFRNLCTRFFCVTQCLTFAFLPQSFVVDFEQQFKSLVKHSQYKGHGKIYYKYPGHLRFESLSKDSPFVFYRNPKSSGHYTPPFPANTNEPGHLQKDIEKNSSFNLARFFDVLKNGLNNNSYYRVVKKKTGVELVFNAQLAKKIQIAKAFLSFKGPKLKFQDLADVSSINITYLDGRRAILDFKNFKKDVKIAKSIFYFNPPPNTVIE